MFQVSNFLYTNGTKLTPKFQSDINSQVNFSNRLGRQRRGGHERCFVYNKTIVMITTQVIFNILFVQSEMLLNRTTKFILLAKILVPP